MSKPLPRYLDTKAAGERKLARILLETGEQAPIVTVTKATLPGDNRRLRGIPVCARGVLSTSPGTDPYTELVRRLDNVRR